MTEAYDSLRAQNELPTMTLVINRDLTIVWADSPALANFGKDIVNQPCHAVLGATGEPCARCVVRECFDDLRPHTNEYEVRIKGNRRRILRRTARPAEFRPDGSPQYVKEIIEDVTAIRIFEKTMQALQQQAPAIKGPVFFNALVLRLCKVLGAQEVFVATFDLEHARAQTIAAAVKCELVTNFDYPLSPAPCRHLQHTSLLSLPSGAAGRYPQCNWLQEKEISGYVGVQLKNSHDWPLGLLAALFRKDLEDAPLIEALTALFAQPAAVALEQLVNQRILEKYRHITATSNDLLALLDRNFVFQIVNRAYAAFYGLTAEQIVGRSMPAVIGSDLFDTTIRPVAEVCFRGRQGRVQLWHPSCDQSRHCLDMAFYPHYEKGTHRVKGFVMCARDITRSKKLEANLRQSAKMEAIGRLASGIVHDFNNILGAVVGYTDLALSTLKGQPEVTKYLREIRQAGLRATELVKQILAFSRQNHEIREPIQPKTMLKEALNLLRATIPADIVIRMILKSEAVIMADPIHLHQIVINLCTNAQHAMQDRGGTFSVRLEDTVLSAEEAKKYSGMQPGPYIRISFTDTGRGIPAPIQAKMFDPFFTTKGKGEGTGIGLTMVDSIVKSYQGRIDLRSEVGRGTTIEILLPVIEAEQEPKSIDPIRLPQGEGQRILVVDDQRKIAEVTGIMLTSLGYRVHIETDSRSALRRFGSDPKAFDLILSDVTMPGMSGDLLTQRILELRPDMPVILMTGHSDRVDQELIRKLGVKKLLSKPLPRNVLATTVRDVLDNDHP
jgi:PAS domain S-box-containing protein